jgi:hypothetical protein
MSLPFGNLLENAVVKVEGKMKARQKEDRAGNITGIFFFKAINNLSIVLRV